MTWQMLFALALWLLERFFMGGPLNFPAELLRAARAAEVTAEKWGHVADAVLSWGPFALLAVGVLIGFVIANALRKPKN